MFSFSIGRLITALLAVVAAAVLTLSVVLVLQATGQGLDLSFLPAPVAARLEALLRPAVLLPVAAFGGLIAAVLWLKQAVVPD